MSDEQIRLREELKVVMHKLQVVRTRLVTLEQRERELLSKIKVGRLTCTECMGRRVVTRRDQHSGSEYDTKCPTCNGAGSVEEKP